MSIARPPARAPPRSVRTWFKRLRVRAPGNHPETAQDPPGRLDWTKGLCPLPYWHNGCHCRSRDCRFSITSTLTETICPIWKDSPGLSFLRSVAFTMPTATSSRRWPQNPVRSPDMRKSRDCSRCDPRRRRQELLLAFRESTTPDLLALLCKVNSVA